MNARRLQTARNWATFHGDAKARVHRVNATPLDDLTDLAYNSAQSEIERYQQTEGLTIPAEEYPEWVNAYTDAWIASYRATANAMDRADIDEAMKTNRISTILKERIASCESSEQYQGAAYAQAENDEERERARHASNLVAAQRIILQAVLDEYNAGWQEQE